MKEEKTKANQRKLNKKTVILKLTKYCRLVFRGLWVDLKNLLFRGKRWEGKHFSTFRTADCISSSEPGR